VLADSHPVDPTYAMDENTYTIWCVNGHLTGENSSRPRQHFENIEKALFGYKSDEEEVLRPRRWDSIIYSNYVQIPVTDYNKNGGLSEEELETGRLRFKRTLDTFKPDFLFAFSFRIWEDLPLGDEKSDPIKDESVPNKELEQRVYGKTKAYKIHYTKRGFSPLQWYPLIHKAVWGHLPQ